MKDFVFVANFSGDILFMNREGDMLFGLSNMDRAFSSNLFESFSEKSKAEVREKIEYAANKKQESIEDIKVETYLPNNCKVLNLMLNLIYDLHGEPTLLAGKLNCADVASDSFQFSKELYLGFINNLPLGVYRTSANGTLHFANKGLVELLGYTSVEELYSENIKDFYVNHDLRDQILTDWPDDKMHSFEFQIYNKDKQIIWVKDSGRAIKDRNGKIIFMDGILEDISKQKENELKLRESENKLKELNASKDKFFSIISHDLRSPFNQLIGATELLLTKLDEYDKVMIRKFLTLLNVEAVQSYRLLENLLQWSKNQRGLIQFDPKPVNLPKLIDDLLLIYAPMATDKKIDIELDIQSDLHYYADKEMLSTIMRNLISNAIKFTEKNGLITIIAKEKMDEENMLNEYLEVSVSDTGIGIPEDTLPKIFTINEANSSKGTYNEFASGLGLVLCKDFVERHNGNIWVESTYGEGSTFYFTLK